MSSECSNTTPKQLHIVGCGGLGHPALWGAIASWSAPSPLSITIIDNDAVEISNLNRQILFSERDVGVDKPHATARGIARLTGGNSEDSKFIECRPLCTTLSKDNIGELLATSDYVIDATDSIQTKFLINDFCVLNRISFCYGGASGTQGQLMSVDSKSQNPACLRCLFGEISKHDYEKETTTCRHGGIIGAVSGHIGFLQINAAFEHLLCKATPSQPSQLVRLSLDSQELQYSDVYPSTDCPLGCGNKNGKILNITDKTCPSTFLYTKLALEELNPGDTIDVLLCSEESMNNVSRSCREENYNVLAKRELFDTGIWRIKIQKPSN